LQHRLLAENTDRLLRYAGCRLPKDINFKTLCRLAMLPEGALHDFVLWRGPFPNMTLDEFLRRKKFSRTDVGRFKGQTNGVAAQPP
jgi:hypothetical protein